MELKIETVNLVDIQPYEKNPLKNDRAVDVVMKSIKEFGFLVPIILDDKNYIVAGHTRVKAAIKLGMSEVPAIYASHLTPDQIKAFRIMDNKSSEYATWDFELLAKELQGLKDLGIELDITGFKESEFNRILNDLNKEPNFGNKAPKYSVVYGELYQLGDHRLICGDSTDLVIVNKLMNGKKVACIFTDPPYGVSYSGTNNPNGREWDVIEGDDLRGDDLYQLIFKAFSNIETYLKQRAALYIFHASRNQMIFETALNKAGFKVKQQLIWHKHHILGHSHYHWCHEPIFYCSRLKEDPVFYGDRIDKTTLNKLDVESLSEKEAKDYLREIQKDSTVWMFKKDGTKDYIHPNQKPTGIAERAIINSSQRGEIIFEPFAGSGSTLIACQKHARKCYAIEYDPIFTSHIIERWEKLTGQTAVKL